MPLLAPEHVARLLGVAQAPNEECPACGRVAPDYCRTCDEFYWIHWRGCPNDETEPHYGHRVYLIPYVRA